MRLRWIRDFPPDSGIPIWFVFKPSETSPWSYEMAAEELDDSCEDSQPLTNCAKQPQKELNDQS